MDMIPRNNRPLSLRDAMSRLFDESIWDPFEDFGREFTVQFPKVDITENDKEVKVVANVPGIDPEEVEVELDENSITLSGTIEREEESDEEHGYRYEREFGEFHRTLPLPARVQSDKAEAEAENGVLTISVPKEKAQSTNKVKVKKK